ncbi:MAG: UDP-glucose/GDP-mannose dehydrogenase family protein [Actinobacteria bacterium]|nr:MAG: UDP-glucose/GDP-mannose dehydrogenase family protein [Actinomycetota bacterium]
MPMANLCIIGTGYVGLVTGACFAKLENNVICVDCDEKKIALLNQGKLPFYEEGLEEVIFEAKANQKIVFSTDLKKAVESSDIVFICVGTPQRPDGSADTSFVLEVADKIGQFQNGPLSVVIKSTAPIEAIEQVKQTISVNSNHPFEIVSNPEFLAQGTAVRDFLKPDRVVIGSKTKEGAESIKNLYTGFDCPIIITDIASAILTKYASNSFLATKISFINEVANLCEKVGANINDVAKGMGLDRRIGPLFLKAGIGFGGSCFPKDSKAMVDMANGAGSDFKILNSVIEVNERQKKVIIDKLKKHLGDLANKKVAFLGVAFKPGTEDTREAPSVIIANKLIEEGCQISAYDPLVKDISLLNGCKVDLASVPYKAIENADAVVVITEYKDFCDLDFSHIKSIMKQPLIIDGRNILDSAQLSKLGFTYEGIGL